MDNSAKFHFDRGNQFAFPKRGGQQDYNEAKKWYRLAAEQNHAASQYRLGHLYYLYGDSDLVLNSREAEKWYGLAAEQGYADAGFWLEKVRTYPESVKQPQ